MIIDHYRMSGKHGNSVAMYTPFRTIRATEMRPDAKLHNPDPVYLRSLIDKAQLSLSETARLIGMTRNGLRNYMRDPSEPLARTADYRVQFALECLANDQKDNLGSVEK